MECVLAIDQGTTGSRALLYGTDGIFVASSYHEFPQHYPRPGWVEHAPEEIWSSVVSCIRDVLSQVSSSSLVCIGITNQRETVVAWDASTGQPLHNAVVWQCKRSAERCATLGADEHARRAIRRITGLPIDPYFSATKVEWLLRNVDWVRESARRGNLRVGTVDSWLLWRLTGGAVHATDFTNASRTMLFDIDRLNWSEDLLSLFDVPCSVLPEVRASSGSFGNTAEGCGLPAGIPITGMAGDQQAALFGQACVVPGSAKNTYGTGAFVLMNSGAQRPSGDDRLITTLGCGTLGEPVYVLEGAVFAAGAVIQWLRDEVGLLSSAATSETMASMVGDNGGVYFVPALQGLGAPYWDADARGAIFGITRATTGNHIVRAGLEAMCYRTMDIVDVMHEDTGLVIDGLRVDGGASMNDFLCQFQSDILGIPVLRPADVETTARGAAYLAGMGLGLWQDITRLHSALGDTRVFTPQMGDAERSGLIAGWRRAIESVRRNCSR